MASLNIAPVLLLLLYYIYKASLQKHFSNYIYSLKFALEGKPRDQMNRLDKSSKQCPILHYIYLSH